MIYLELLIGFLKVGLFAFGGAYAAIPLIRDVVLSYGWLGEDALTDMIAVSESTPGPIMVNLATYVGAEQAGLPGAVIATTAVVLPCFVIMLLVMVVLERALRAKAAQAVFGGLRACVAGIVLAVGVCMIFRQCFGAVDALSFDLTAVVFTAALALVYFGSRRFTKNGMSPVLLIALAAVAGIFVYGFV